MQSSSRIYPLEELKTRLSIGSAGGLQIHRRRRYLSRRTVSKSVMLGNSLDAIMFEEYLIFNMISRGTGAAMYFLSLGDKSKMFIANLNIWPFSIAASLAESYPFLSCSVFVITIDRFLLISGKYSLSLLEHF